MDSKPRILRIRKDDCAVVAFPAGESLFIEGSVSRSIEPLAEETRHGMATEIVFAEDTLVVLDGLELIRCSTSVHVWQAAALLYARKDRRPEEGVRLDFRGRFVPKQQSVLGSEHAPELTVESGVGYALIYRDEELLIDADSLDSATGGWLVRSERVPGSGTRIRYTVQDAPDEAA